MEELSLNILDVVQNSITAQASLIEIEVDIDNHDFLTITIKDNGNGMDETAVKNALNPFYTTKSERNIGLGIPLFKQSAELTGGVFDIKSELNKGTVIKAVFDTNHIDYTPLGAVWDTVALLIQMNGKIDFVYTVKKDNQKFVCDTRKIKNEIGDLLLTDIKTIQLIKQYIEENHKQILKRSY